MIVKSLENIVEPRMSVEVSALLVKPPYPPSVVRSALLLCPAAGPAALAPPSLLLRPSGTASLATQHATSCVEEGMVIYKKAATNSPMGPLYLVKCT